jgi:predicted Zn-dependent protease
MENALREIAPTHPKGWPTQLNLPLDDYITMLGTAGRFAAAEVVLADHLENPLNAQQSFWLLSRRNQLYIRALRDDGHMSLGTGKELFANLEEHLLEQTETSDDNHRRQTVTQIIDLYAAAHEKEIVGYQEHFRNFAFNTLPPILKRQTNNYQVVVRQTADKLKELMGPRVGVEFLIERFETYPERFAYTYDSPWNRFASSLTYWFAESKRKIGSYEPRLLAIVENELRHDLRTRRSRNRYLYHHAYSQYFWKEKSAEFYRVAEEQYQEQKDSGRSVTYIAQYLDHGLGKRGRAIEIMMVAYQNKLLDTPQQIVLCNMLLGHARHPQSIAILQPIIESSPDNMTYRTMLMRAYSRSSRIKEMRTLLTTTDKHFRQQGRWTEANIANLALCCLQIDLFSESVGYYNEVIALHQRRNSNVGIGSGALSGYYDYQSQAYTGLGQTIKAVDAAAAGFIATRARYGNTMSSPHRIDSALFAAKDLDDYVNYLDKQVATTGQDSPLIRQRLGRVFASRQKHAEAVVQLRMAVELQPTDAKTHEALIKSYEGLKDQDAVVRQTLAWLDFDRHNLDLYKKLAQRLQSDEALFERAATTIVEAAPQDSKHHQALAEIRQQQERWDDAIEHWKHVARLRALEPNGLLMLTEAQLHEEQWDAARDSIQQLNQTNWPERFDQVRTKTEQLQRRLPR